MSTGNLLSFIVESNRIENIHDLRIAHEQYPLYEAFLLAPLAVETVVEFTRAITGGKGELRERRGMNVRVGPHRPPPGGREIRPELRRILNSAADPWATHVRYESLHPFTDGNGRSGRAIWLHMRASYVIGESRGCNVQKIPPSFLHLWYYASLNNWRERLSVAEAVEQ